MTTHKNSRSLTHGALPIAIAAALASPFAIAQSLPTGGVAVLPPGGIAPNIITSGTTMTVVPGSPRSVINWTTFDVANGYTFVFDAANSTNILLNRVTGSFASNIDGLVQSTGQVWLLNANGIAVGSTGRFDVAGLMLSTGAMTDADFFDGNTRFDISGAMGTVSVAPGAELRATNGPGAIALIANQVNFAGIANAGTGEVALVGAQGVSVEFDGNLNAFTTLTMDAGSNQTVGTHVSGGEFTASRTVLAAAGMTTGQGNVLLDSGSSPWLTFHNGDIVIHSRDGDVVNQRSITAPGDLSITAGNNIDFNGGSASVAGDYSVTADDFYAGVFNATLTGIDSSLSITDTAGGLTVGSLTAPGDINLATANGGGLTISNWDPAVPLQAGGDIRLTTTGGGDITINGDLSTGPIANLWLNSSGRIRQTGGVASTRYVSAQAVNGIQLDGANLFGTGSFRNSGTGGVALRSDSAGFVLGAAQTGSGDVTVTATNGIVLDGAVVDTGNGNVRIEGNASVTGPSSVSASGAVTFNGAIDAAASMMDRRLEVTSGAGTFFNGSVGATSALDMLIVHGTSTFRGTGVHTLQGLFLDDVSIAPATGNTFGMSVQGGNLVVGDIAVDPLWSGTVQLAGPLIQAGSFTAPNAGLDVAGSTTSGYTQLGAIDAGGLVTVNGFDVEITGTVQAAGTIDVDAGRNLQVDTLRSTGGDVIVSSGTGTLHAGTLEANRHITVTGGSLVDIGQADASGDLSITATSGNLQLGSGSGTFTTLTAAGDIMVTGALDTLRLTGSAGGAAAFTGDNTISTLGGFTADSLQLRNVGSLSIAGTVDVGAGDARFDVIDENFQIDPTGQVRGGNITVNANNFYNTSGADGLVASGHWVVYQRSPSFAPMYDGLDSGATAIWGQTIDSLAPSSITGNRYVFAFQPTLTFTSTDIAKTYGTDLAGVAGGLFTVSGLQAGVAGAYLGDTLSSVFSGSPLVSSTGFAPRASVAGGPYAIVLSNGTLVSTAGYRFAFDNAGRVTVNPLGITGTVTVDPKVYDGTTTGTGTVTLNGVLTGDNVGTTGTTFTFADKDAGTGKTVTIGGTALTGTDAGNYTLTVPASVLADILRKALTATIIVDGRTYDGTTNATGSITLDGVVAGDSVGTTGTTFTFDDKNAGSGKTVTISGTTLTGADAGNYTLTLPASVLGEILRKAITGTVVIDTKTYDGTTDGTGTVTLDGVIAGDSVGTGGTTFTFDDKNAGAGKTVTISGATLTGADAGNYTLTLPASVLGEILRKAITGTVVVDTKIYDGTTDGTGTVMLDGVIAGDSLGTTGTTFTFDDKNAGAGKTVTIGGTTLTGADAGNYTLTLSGTALADILQRAITVTADPHSKPSGSEDPTLTWTVTDGSLVAGDGLTGALTRAPGEAVGTYAIGQGTLDASSNYRLTFIGSTLTITELPLDPGTDVVTGRRPGTPTEVLGNLAGRNPVFDRDEDRLEVVDERDDCSGRDGMGRDCGSARPR